jgi:Tfp pilus tip-associated adhesin PilY1
VTINGVSPAGYNGTFNISCANTLLPPACDNNIFTYPVTTGLGTPSGTTITASAGTGPAVTGTLANHGFTAGQSITIAGATTAGFNSTFSVLTTPDANTFTFSTGLALAAPGGSPTARLTNNPVSYATITGHGYGAAGASVANFSVTGASPAGYNVSNVTATVVDANTVSYGVTGLAAGTNLGIASGSIIASTAGTVANATSTAHGFVDQSTVTISGATPSAFNGSFTVTVTGPDTFTYNLGSAQKDASGTIVAIPSGGGASDRDLVINWIRGMDNFEDENSNSSFADTRASIHGDVLHSRPAVVNYNRRTDTANINNDVYIYYGGNDGVFRAVKGGFGSSTGDPAPGTEVWGFVAREHFPFLRRLRINTPSISSSYKKPYFFDGPIGAYTLDANGDGKLTASGTPNEADYTQDKVWLFLAMRRGGRFIYALDVTDPLVPRLLWRKGCPSLETDPTKVDSATGCDLGWGELGYTTSEPKVISSNCTSTSYNCGANDPLLMFGAGYDPAVEDIDPSSVVSENSSSVTTATATINRTMGRGIYVVNARTGAIVWQAAGHSRADSSTHTYLNVSGMSRAISSDIAVVLGDPTPKPFRAYVGDGRARMWRIDFGDANPANWTVARLADVGNAASISGRRKFMFPPDVIGGTGFDMVISGTGDREHPFDTGVVNRVYMFKDTRQTNPAFVSGSQVQPTITHADTMTFKGSSIEALLDVTNNCIQIPAQCGANSMGSPEVATTGFTASQNDSAAVSDTNNEGWFITLRPGEKQEGSTLAAGSGAIVFGTNQPSSSAGGGACSPNLGVARQYTVNALDGTAFIGTTTSTIYPGGGYLPSPVLVYVGLGGATGTGTVTSGGVPVGGSVSGGQLTVGAGASLGGGNDPTGVVCYGASCMLAPGKQLYSRLRKFWYKEID